MPTTMDIEKWNFIATQIGAVFAVLAFLFSFLTYQRSRKRSVAIESRLRQIDGKAVATIRAINLGQPLLVIERIALSFIVWDNSPRLIVPKPLKLLRFIEPLIDFESSIQYMSDSAIVNATSPFPVPAPEHFPVTVNIDLDGLMEAFILRGERFSGRLEFSLHILLLKAVVITPVTKYLSFANYEIRYYLWRKYKNDSRLIVQSS